MYCLGVDASKQHLVTYDGERWWRFPNTRDLKELAAFLKGKGNEVTVVSSPPAPAPGHWSSSAAPGGCGVGGSIRTSSHTCGKGLKDGGRRTAPMPSFFGSMARTMVRGTFLKRTV